MQPIARLLLTLLAACTFVANANAAGCASISMGTPMKEFVEQQQEYQSRIKEYKQQTDALSAAIKSLHAEIDDLKAAVYNDVDAVYTISESFTPDDIKKLGTNKRLIFHQYIYADLDKHRVSVVIFRRQNFFSLNFCVNEVCSFEKNDINADITAFLKEHPLKAAVAGVEWSKTFAYPEHIQKIELEPVGLHWDAGAIASVDGYIIVKRATAAGGMK
jgi:hypothetical protein